MSDDTQPKRTRLVLAGSDDWSEKHANVYEDGMVLFSDEHADNVVTLSHEQFAVVVAVWQAAEQQRREAGMKK